METDKIKHLGPREMILEPIQPFTIETVLENARQEPVGVSSVYSVSDLLDFEIHNYDRGLLLMLVVISLFLLGTIMV